MEIIDRYIYAVCSKLPEKQRDDIAKEIRTLIDDMMENYPQESESIRAEKVLLELGDPSKLADKYMDKNRYLIGPKVFNKYIFVLKIVLLAVFIGISIATVVEDVFVENNDYISSMSNYFTNLVSALLQAFTWVTVIFALVEYNGVDILAKESQWSLSNLPPVPHKKAVISRAESIVGIIFTTLFVIVLYFIPEILAAYIPSSNDDFVVIHILNIDNISDFKIIILGIFFVCITREMLKIIFGKWSIKLALYYSVLTIISLILFLFIFMSPSIWNPDFINEISKYIDGDFTLSMEKVKSIVLSIIILGTTLDIVSVIYKSIKYNTIKY